MENNIDDFEPLSAEDMHKNLDDLLKDYVQKFGVNPKFMGLIFPGLESAFILDDGMIGSKDAFEIICHYFNLVIKAIKTNDDRTDFHLMVSAGLEMIIEHHKKMKNAN